MRSLWCSTEASAQNSINAIHSSSPSKEQEDFGDSKQIMIVLQSNQFEMKNNTNLVVNNYKNNLGNYAGKIVLKSWRVPFSMDSVKFSI